MKKIIALALSVMMAVSAMGVTAMADDEPIKVLINGSELVIPEGDTQPFIDSDRTLVPMRAIFEALGAKVNWDGETRTIVSYDPISDTSITMQIDSATMFVGETPVTLDVPAKIVNDRTVVPIRAIAEGMNSQVGWDGATRTVTVNKDLAKDAGPGNTQDPKATEIANPWTEFETLDELNKALDGAFVVVAPAVPAETTDYRYLEDEKLVELPGYWAVGPGYELNIRTAPGDTDISGISGAEKVETYNIDGNGPFVQVGTLGDIIYAVWTSEAKGTVFSHSVALTQDETDLSELLKTIVADYEKAFVEANK